MGDIVATIQADQDRIIRADPGGILVVEGGPGTGKTVVALHRAAYLLYTHRKRLARRGILVIGPSATFLRYIDQVLPSLGENDVVLATVGSLFPGVDAGRHGHAAGRPGQGQREDGGRPGEGRRRAAPGAGRRHRDQGRRHRLPAHAPDLRQARDRGGANCAIPTPATRCRTTRPGACSSARWCASWPGSGRATSAASGSAARTTRRSCAPNWPPRRPSAACSTCCGPSSRRSSCSPGSTSSPACSTWPTTSAPPSPATRRGRGHPPTCRCSTSSPSCSAPSRPPRPGGQRASAPPTRPSAPRRSSTRRSWWRSSPRTRPSSCRPWRTTRS